MKPYLHAILLFVFSTSTYAQTSLPAVTELDAGWNTIATDGVCSTGTPYQFYARTSADSDNLLIFFNNGGACWFGQACDLASQPNVHLPFADADQNNPALGGGIFALDNPANPFADYDMVFVPYCTGDVHMGAGERVYTYSTSKGDITFTTWHNGYVNSTTVLNWVYKNFPSPAKIVMSGSSAGAIGASFYAGLVAEHYSGTPVVLLADGAGGYGSPNLPKAFTAWNTAAILPDWEEYAGQSNDTITFEDFYIASANHNSNLTIAQYNAAEDQVQINFTMLLGDKPDSFDLPQRILNNYVKIESAVDNFYSYTAGGKVHTIMEIPIFYSYEVEGVPFRDWVENLIKGETVRDISCVNEPAGCAEAPE